MAARNCAGPREAYKTRCAVNDLLGLSTAVGLLIEGTERRLHEQQIEATLTDEEQERLKDFFVTLQRVAEDIADFARELAEHVQEP